ncbi:MAG: metal-dependent hydrolase [Gammaproteobacteria bacterium]|nr:MAG: metal-dependent hydrolase [Gammaproteobacteria bacterium]
MKIFSTFIFLLLIGCSQPVLDPDPLEQAHIIDWHVHVAGMGFGDSGNFINEEMRDNFRFDFFLSWMDVTEKELEKNGDQILVKKLNNRIVQSKYVDQAVVLALDGVIDEKTKTLDHNKTQVYVSNEFVASQTAKYQSLLFGASINPNREDSLELLDEVYQQGAVLIKWIPSIMYIDPSDEKFIPFYKRMAELNLPLLTHTGMEKSFANAKDHFSDPRLLELPLRCGVTVIAAHIATTGESDGQDNFERILPMFDEFPNLYTDISSLTQVNKLGYLAKAIKHPGLTERMIYGSDWPLSSFPLVSPFYHMNHIGIKKSWRVSQYKNKWDLDIKLKEAFGVPHTVFTRKLGILDMTDE